MIFFPSQHATYLYQNIEFLKKSEFPHLMAIADHIDRLKQGKCKPENNTIFINLVSNLERIGDHLYYIVR